MSLGDNPTPNDRLLGSIRALIRAEIPRLAYMTHWEYVVAATDGVTVDCSPSDTTITLPQMVKIPLRTGIGGAKSTPAVGSKLVVGFLNADPTRPYVAGGFDSANATALALSATAVNIGFAAVDPVAKGTETATLVTAIGVLVAAINTWQAAVVTGGGAFSDVVPSNRAATNILQTALGVAATACTAGAAAIPSVSVKVSA